jgi:glycosyltransferase involved in cell wall biosynthesis
VIEGLDARAGFRSNDVEDAAAALRAFADDPDRRHALEEAARARALTEFSLARQAQRTDEVYRDAIAGRRR